MTCAHSADGRLHICWTDGRYVGQVRGRGYRKWRTVTGKCATGEAALARALLKMRHDDLRARALFIPNGMSYYGPSLALEANRA